MCAARLKKCSSRTWSTLGLAGCCLLRSGPPRILLGEVQVCPVKRPFPAQAAATENGFARRPPFSCVPSLYQVCAHVDTQMLFPLMWQLAAPNATFPLTLQDTNVKETEQSTLPTCPGPKAATQLASQMSQPCTSTWKRRLMQPLLTFACSCWLSDGSSSSPLRSFSVSIHQLSCQRRGCSPPPEVNSGSPIEEKDWTLMVVNGDKWPKRGFLL